MTRDALEGFVKEQLEVIFEAIQRQHKRMDDLQETLGGVEAQVHELRNGKPPHPSIVGWDELVDRVTKAENLLAQARAQRDAYEQALVSVVESIKEIL